MFDYAKQQGTDRGQWYRHSRDSIEYHHRTRLPSTSSSVVRKHGKAVSYPKRIWQVPKIPGESTCNKERNWWQKRRSIRWRKITFPPPFFRQVSLNWEISPVRICSTHGLWRQKSRIEATLKGNLGAVLQSLG